MASKSNKFQIKDQELFDKEHNLQLKNLASYLDFTHMGVTIIFASWFATSILAINSYTI